MIPWFTLLRVFSCCLIIPCTSYLLFIITPFPTGLFAVIAYAMERVLCSPPPISDVEISRGAVEMRGVT